MGVSCTSLRVSGGEHGVNKNKGTDDLSTESGPLVVTIGQLVGTTTVSVVVRALESLHQTNTTNGTQTLRYHVANRPDQRHLSRQKQPECHGRVNVSSWRILANTS
ncbi:hypothetical protein Hanom_Chr11g01045681 [Helianthus anomalus]